MITSQQSSIPVRVAAIDEPSPGVRTFRLEHRDGHALPAFSGGSHVVVSMRGAARTFRNPYSLMGPTDDTSHYAIAVRRDDTGRGGSVFLHESVREGDELEITAPVNLFRLNAMARHHVLIAGGIGVTPMLAHSDEARRQGLSYEVHYQVRGVDTAPFVDRIRREEGGRARLYDSGAGEYIDPVEVFRRQPLGTHVYVCGPAGLIQAVYDAAARLGWPSGTIHSEAFTAPPPGKAFTLVLAQSNMEVDVPADMSPLEALEAAGLEPPCSCRGGACGVCETAVIEGDIEHNDHFLSDEVKVGNARMMICVSRGRSDRVVLDL
ncbi:PDR/VanB family oxidoreductase [Aquisalimonas asiatica]|uniref:Ferredoxin-NADP reductase n=1 Tax=Aquisalimonas asiatica TaxID=406100 RepID=A0A1H8Q0I3_9GAMM|nr:PDR/VanB family oxidoreductase [Aquisalimonas asiatica]SEO47293.1 Ferredoxin-NADP reductase [Aquisalimonas asiatica]